MTAAHFDPFSRTAQQDPYPAYRRLRDEAPVYHNAGRGFWAVSRYADVVAVSRDWETYTVTRGVDIDNAGDVLGSGFFLTRDPPVHTAYRNVVKAAFAPRVTRESLEAPVRALVEEFVGAVVAKGEFDLGMDLCWPLPARVMGRFLGYPPGDCAELTRLGMEFLVRDVGTVTPPEISNNAGLALMQYFQDIVAARRAHPKDDLLTHIATAEVDGQPMGDSAAGMALMIFVGGFENVGCSLVNALALLAQHPEQRAWLAQHPDQIPVAFEETLRFDTPQQNFKRTTTRDVELHGVHIPAGSPVYLLYGSANRDERQFQRAEEFDLRLDRGRNATFGEGVHFCIGAPLARLEGRVVLETVLKRMPEYELTGTPVRLPSHAVRGYESLPARVR